MTSSETCNFQERKQVRCLLCWILWRLQNEVWTSEKLLTSFHRLIQHYPRDGLHDFVLNVAHLNDDIVHVLLLNPNEHHTIGHAGSRKLKLLESLDRKGWGVDWILAFGNSWVFYYVFPLGVDEHSMNIFELFGLILVSEFPIEQMRLSNFNFSRVFLVRPCSFFQFYLFGLVLVDLGILRQGVRIIINYNYIVAYCLAAGFCLCPLSDCLRQ